jgi:glutamate dehydrogenase (NAD(P)+)
VVGYFEWVQDLQSFFWTDAEVAAELDRVMDDATRAVMAAAEQHHADLRTAALMVAVGRTADATTLRGLYPSGWVATSPSCRSTSQPRR